MAADASPIRRGVPALRAAQGHSFFWRRLHSLSGIIPVGAFLVEHFISNAFATNGPYAYADQVKFLSGLPFVLFLEVLGSTFLCFITLSTGFTSGSGEIRM